MKITIISGSNASVKAIFGAKSGFYDIVHILPGLAILGQALPAFLKKRQINA